MLVSGHCNKSSALPYILKDREKLQAKGDHILKTFIQKDKRPRKNIPNKDYYRSLLDVKHEAAILLDFDGDILLLNSGFEDLSGHAEQDIAEVPARHLFLRQENDVNPLMNSNLKEFDTSFFLLTAQPSLLPVQFKCQEIEGQKYLGIITRQKPASQKQEAQKQVIAESPVARSVPEKEVLKQKIPVQNDIRTALNGIIGYGALLLQEDSVTKDQRALDFAQGIMKNSKRIKLLLDKVNMEHDMGGGQKNVSSFSLEMLVKQVESTFSKQLRERRLSFNYRSSQTYMITSDEDCLQRVLHFLFEKAVLYSRSDQIEVHASHNAAQESFEIKIDNIGLDIPQSIVQHIQRENSKSHYQLAHPALNGHDKIKGMLMDLNLLEARLFFDTASGLSQVARLVFPDSVLESAEEIEKRYAVELRKKQLKVLVVEDDEVSAHILNLFLKDIADVEMAFSGNEALNIVEHFYGQGMLFDMFLLDINLPAPWDGFMLKQEIISKWPDYSDVPFIAQTANTAVECISQVNTEKFSACLYKPVIKAELLRLMNKYGKK